MENNIQNLLAQVNLINKKYEEIAKITGENFNIFSVLRLESDEVRLHSRLIGELLNPKGRHGQNELFLKLFISTIGLEDQYQLEQIKNATVIVEENIGNIPDDYSKGGRIDLIIKFPSNRKEIVIENKIYAGDQFNQLGRYFAQYPHANIIYLTPQKKEPTKESLGENLKLENVICLTYQIEIKNWLEACIEKSASIPLLRETITQYLNLIKHITHQSSNKIKEMEIETILLNSEESFKSAEKIGNSVREIKNNIFTNCKNELIQRWSKEYGDKGLELFKFNEFTFYIKPSGEDDYFHFDLFPLKNNILGFANQEELKIFRDITLVFEGREASSFWYNNNYSVWVRLKYDLASLTFEEYKKLNSDRTEWLNNAMNEGTSFIKHIVNSLKELNNTEIKINDKFVQ